MVTLATGSTSNLEYTPRMCWTWPIQQLCGYVTAALGLVHRLAAVVVDSQVQLRVCVFIQEKGRGQQVHSLKDHTLGYIAFASIQFNPLLFAQMMMMVVGFSCPAAINGDMSRMSTDKRQAKSMSRYSD